MSQDEQAAPTATTAKTTREEGARVGVIGAGVGGSPLLLAPLPPSPDLPPVPSLRPCSLADFDVLARLGGGSFSDVLCVRPLRTWAGLWEGEDVMMMRIALKVVDKHLLLRSAARERVDGNGINAGASAAAAERATLASLRGCYGINQLLFTFQDESSLFFGLELVPGGELFDQVQEAKREKKEKETEKEKERKNEEEEEKNGDGENGDGEESVEDEEGANADDDGDDGLLPVLPLGSVRAYASQLLLILHSLRSRRVAHRDLKPENLLLDEAGRLKLIDFGCATWFDDEGDDDEENGEKEEQDGESGSDDEDEEEEEEDLPATAEEAAARALRRRNQQSRERSQHNRDQHPLSRSRRGGAAAEFVGTADYLPPEALGAFDSRGEREHGGRGGAAPLCRRRKRALRSGACPARDLWALGCVLYQLLCGRPPFRAASEYLTYQKISAGGELRWPSGFPGRSAESENGAAAAAATADLVERLLERNPLTRLGASSLEEVAAHPFFEGVDWAAVAGGRERGVPRPLEISSRREAAGDGGLGVGGAGDLDLDWELLSIAAAGAPPLRYELYGDGSGGGGEGGGGVVLGGGVHALSSFGGGQGGGGGGGGEGGGN